MYKIAFCAGHGTNTAGKRTPDGEREWAFNNKVAVAFENELKKYKGVELLRTDDRTGMRDVPLSERTGRANAWGANVYISFHHNANTGKWGNWTGVETYYHAGSAQGKRLAQLVNKAVVKAYGLKDRGLKTNNLHITRVTKMPSVLVEGGFMDSTVDIKKLRDDKVLENAGRCIAQAVVEYTGLKKEVKAAETSTRNLYRIRKSWADSRSQLGAFANLQSAIDLATKNKGYKVFDDAGKEVFAETVKVPTKANDEFLARVTASGLNIRSGPGTSYKVNGTIRDKGTYTIVDTNGKWGKLKSGAGWIHLDYTKKL